MTPLDHELIDAIEACDKARAQAAIARGANVRCRDTRPVRGAGNTPLHTAAAAGSSELVRLLLRAGADVNARCDSGWTPLMRACNVGDLNISEMLLDAGADPHVRNAEGYTAYGRVPGNRTDLIALLKARGASNE